MSMTSRQLRMAVVLGTTLFKKVTAWLFYRLLDRLSDVKIPRDAGDFRLIDG